VSNFVIDQAIFNMLALMMVKNHWNRYGNYWC